MEDHTDVLVTEEKKEKKKLPNWIVFVCGVNMGLLLALCLMNGGSYVRQYQKNQEIKILKEKAEEEKFVKI